MTRLGRLVGRDEAHQIDIVLFNPLACGTFDKEGRVVANAVRQVNCGVERILSARIRNGKQHPGLDLNEVPAVVHPVCSHLPN